MLVDSFIISVCLFMINVPQVIRLLQHDIGIGTFIKKTIHPKRWVAGFIGFFTWAILYTTFMPIFWFYFSLILMRILIAPFEFFIARFSFREPHRIRLEELGKFFFIVLVLSFLVFGASIYAVSVDRPVANAAYFNTLITEAGNGPFFTTEIPTNSIRLITPELAQSLAEQHLSSFGSNMEVKSVHISIINGSLMWVAGIGSTNTIAENYLAGLVLVSATDPSAEVVLVKQHFTLGEGLFFLNDIRMYSFEKNPTISYGRAFITLTPENKWVYVVTKIDLGVDLIAKPAGVIIYDTDGNLIGEYTKETTPDWVPQIYDEDWIELKISEWGDFKRGEEFDFWASGFLWIEPSRDRVAISEDLRYIMSPDTGKMQGIITVHPATSDRTLAGVFVVNISGIFYYDYREYNYISGGSAMNYVESKLTQPAQGFYYATMPLLYPITVNGELRLVWFVPVYWAQYDADSEEVAFIRFAGLGLIDAKDPSYIIVNTQTQGKTGEQIIDETKAQFKALFGEETHEEINTVEITSNVTATYTYIKDGKTHIVLELENDTYTYIEGTPDSLNATEWYQLLKTQPGDLIKARIQLSDDGRWIIIAFENLSL